MRLFYATTNPGKIFEVGKFLKPFGIELLGPKDLGLSIDVPEEGETLEENAIAKAQAYLDAGVDMPVISDDTGIEIDVLDGEPGIHVRRWKDKKTRMSDEEVIDYCLMRMKGIHKSKRVAQFRTVIAVGVCHSGASLQAIESRGLLPKRSYRPAMAGLQVVEDSDSGRDDSIELFDGVLRGVILEKPAPMRIEGFPFESLFYIPEWKMVLGDVHQLPIEKKRKFLTHRERAMEKVLPRLRALLPR